MACRQGSLGGFSMFQVFHISQPDRLSQIPNRRTGPAHWTGSSHATTTTLTVPPSNENFSYFSDDDVDPAYSSTKVSGWARSPLEDGSARWTGFSHGIASTSGCSQISQITVPTRDEIFSGFSDHWLVSKMMVTLLDPSTSSLILTNIGKLSIWSIVKRFVVGKGRILDSRWGWNEWMWFNWWVSGPGISSDILASRNASCTRIPVQR